MIYFDNACTSLPKAPGAAKAASDVLEHGCFNINRGGYAGAYEMSSLVYDTREKLAKLFDCPDARRVIFTCGTTLSVNMTLKGLVKPGDHVVTAAMEHNAVARPLKQLEEAGVSVQIARCNPDGTLDLEDMESKITARTRLVVITHASNVCGSIMPVRKVGELCRKHGALLVVDAAQTAGVLPISMQEDNIDALAFPAHKGLLSAPGIGGLILSERAAKEIRPLIAGGTGSHSHMEDMPEEFPDRLEAGTLNLPGVAALSAALDYILKTGITAIYEKEMALLARLTSGIASIEGVRLVGTVNPIEKCAIAALDFTSVDNAEAAVRLDAEYDIMMRCGLHCAPWAHKTLGTFPRGVVRCSLGHMNTEDEIDRLLEALVVVSK